MRFGPVQKTYFNATDGAYSVVTEREVYDSQITLTGEEVELVQKHFGPAGIHHGNVKSNKEAALKNFTLYTPGSASRQIQLNLVYCKDDKSELRLYLRGKVFKPDPKTIWFLFVSNGALVIGAMAEDKWRSLGREDVYDDDYIADIYQEPKPIQYVQSAGGLIFKRDPKLAVVRFKIANYKCEINPDHKLFISRSTGFPFLEAHHLLPIKYQQAFNESLDIKDNIVALCPYCHRLIHHATVKETRPLLDNLIASRSVLSERYNVNQIALYRFYNCEEILAN